jgi:transposase InsO family protein
MVLLMPWLEIRPMDQKIGFIKRVLLVNPGDFAGLCRTYGIARKTGYKWLGRYRAGQTMTALTEHSRRPFQSPRWTAATVEQRILELRAPDGWGARKIAQLLWEAGCSISVATVHRTLMRFGAVHRLDQHGEAITRFERAVPNDLLQADFKGPMGRAGQREKPLTVLDDHSRFALGVFALRDHTSTSVQGCFVEVFERYGVPRQMLLDHGTPWWNSRNGWGLSRLAVFLIQQGIELIFSRVGHPQTQGKIERFHRTLQRSMIRQGLPEHWAQWQPRYDGFVQRYNQVRPHEALGMKRPAEYYRPSERRYASHVPAWAYPAGLEVCRVDSSGSVRVDGHRYFVCEGLVHQTVGLEHVGEQVLVRFRHMYLRELNLRKQATLPFVYPVTKTPPTYLFTCYRCLDN